MVDKEGLMFEHVHYIMHLASARTARIMAACPTPSRLEELVPVHANACQVPIIWHLQTL